jgi:hypothetical protein
MRRVRSCGPGPGVRHSRPPLCASQPPLCVPACVGLPVRPCLCLREFVPVLGHGRPAGSLLKGTGAHSTPDPDRGRAASGSAHPSRHGQENGRKKAGREATRWFRDQPIHPGMGRRMGERRLGAKRPVGFGVSPSIPASNRIVPGRCQPIGPNPAAVPSSSVTLMNQSFLLEASALPIQESTQDRIMPQGYRASLVSANVTNQSCRAVSCLVGASADLTNRSCHSSSWRAWSVSKWARVAMRGSVQKCGASCPASCAPWTDPSERNISRAAVPPVPSVWLYQWLYH